MANGDSTKRLAVLIDADNASAKIAEGLFEEIAKLGEASVRRIYGDFSSPQSKPWSDVLTRYAILPQQQFAYVKGKNASDIALVIDAMDLLHSGRFSGFCLVSSDSDFTRLASRIREEGVDVYGFGEQKTPESFKQACRRFIYTENLLPDAPAKAGTPETAKPPLEPIGNAERLFKRAMGEMETDGGWVALSSVRNQVVNLAPDFDPRTYGFKKVSDLVRKIASLELNDEGSGRVRLKLKSEAPTKPAAKGKAKQAGQPAKTAKG